MLTRKGIHALVISNDMSVRLNLVRDTTGSVWRDIGCRDRPEATAHEHAAFRGADRYILVAAVTERRRIMPEYNYRSIKGCIDVHSELVRLTLRVWSFAGPLLD